MTDRNMQTQIPVSEILTFQCPPFIVAIRPVLHTYPITSIPPRSLALPNNLHHLSPSKSIIPSHRICNLNPRQLRLLQPIPGQQFLLLLRSHNNMSWNKFMVSDVDQEF